MLKRSRLTFVIVLLLIAAGTVFAWSLAAGDVALSAQEIMTALLSAGDDGNVVRTLRFPRALSAFACGGLLAVAGALMQVMLRNPLADPYILGISGGAAVGALISILLGTSALLTSVSAFGGAFGVTLLVFGLAHSDGSWSQLRLLLTGVVVAAGCGAVVTLLLALSPDTQVHSMLFWIMGDASDSGNPWPVTGILLFGLTLAFFFARDLNVLTRGELTARSLGVDVRRLRWGLYSLASLLTAAAVTQIGTVGFIGLIVPHLVRLLTGNDQRILLPAAALTGGTLLLAADTAARTIIAPTQLPVGVLTAMIGVPVFLFLLTRQTK